MSVIITVRLVVSSTLLGLFSTEGVAVNEEAAGVTATTGDTEDTEGASGEEGGDGGDGDDRFSRIVFVGSSLVSFFVN